MAAAADATPVSIPSPPPIPVQLLGLAWPLIVSILLTILDSANIRYWLGHELGVEGTAVHTVTATVVGLAQLLFSAIVMGCGVLVARAVGARDGRGLSLIGSAISVVGVMWLVVIAVVVAIVDPLSAYLAKNTVSPADIHTFVIWWCALAVPAVALAQVFVAAANGAGLTRFAMSQGIVHILVTVGLLPLFLVVLHQGYRAPALSVCGASLVNVGQLSIRLLHQAKERHLGERVDQKVVLDTQVWREMLNIGLPAQLSRATSWVVIIAVVLRVREAGVTVLAGYGIAMQLVDISGGASGGFAGATQILLAQSLGARNPARARQVLKTALKMSLLFPMLTVAILAALAGPLTGILASGPEAHSVAIRALRLMMWALFPAAAWQVLLNAFAAARATKRVLVVTLVAQAIALTIASLWTGDRIWGALISIGTMYTLSVTFYLLLSIPVLWRGALAEPRAPSPG